MSPAADAPFNQDRFDTIEGYAEQNRKKPLVLAIAVHLAVVAIMLLPSSLFDFSRNREEIYTVNLFDAVESAPARPAPAPAPSPAPVAKKQEPPPPPVVKKIETPPVPIKEAVVVEKPEPVISTETESVAPAEVISLKPKAVKKDLKPKKVEIKPTPKEEIKVDQAINRLKNELNRKQAERKAKEMQVQAEAAVDDAVAKLRESIRTQGQWTSTARGVQPSVKSQTSSGTSGSGSGIGTGAGGGDAKLDAALRRYYIAVSQKIHENWILPEMQEWKKDLKAVLVVNVRRDGVVTEYEFEEKSSNPFFDQFVEKTLKESLPLPPFPDDIEESSLEIGLVFHPSGLQ